MPRLAITARLARLATVAALVAAPLAATPLAAQGSDTTGALPFRAGQWATQFGFDGTFASAGVLRFRSPSSAWVLDASGSVNRYTLEVPSDVVEDDEADATDFAAFLQLGMRRYRAIATRTTAFAGAGVYGSTIVTRSAFGSLPPAFYTQRTGAAGLYGEMGATWMVSRNLGLSGATQLAATYNWGSLEQPIGLGETTRTETTGYGLRLSRTRLMVTVYF